MKYPILLLTAIFISLGSSQYKAEVTKRALIVAIGNYPEYSGWSSISSVNDIPLIQSTLEAQGFTEFTIIQDKDATKERIKDEFSLLTERSAPGDIVVVHFSSHGQQIMDDNRDELDGFDEAIVAYGAPAEYETGYLGEQHIRDEELGGYLEVLRTKLSSSGEVLLLVDACHSGTATRGGKTRGNEKPFAPPGYVPPKVENNTDVSIFENNPMSAEIDNSGKAPMVVISAARAHELNYEYKGNGSLSLAFSKSFKNFNESTSYRSLFSRILKEMSLLAPNQNPAIEGDIDRIVLNGKAVIQEPYFNVTNLDYDAVTINGGSLTGLNDGTTIKLFPSGTVDTKDIEPIAKGVITFSEAFIANAILEEPLEGDPKDYWVFVDQKSFGEIKMSVRFGDLSGSAKQKDLEEIISKIPLMQIEENADFEIVKSGEYLQIVRTQDRAIYKDKIRIESAAATFKNVSSSYCQGKFLKEVEFENSAYAIEMKLIPITMAGTRVIDTLDPSAQMDAGGIPGFTTKDKALIQITNNSSFAVYFNIIDIQPDGVVNPVVPNPKRHENASDYKIGAGETKIIDRKFISFAPPYGTETFKIFASYEPINFGPIFMTKNASARNAFTNELEKLFADSYTMSRGTPVGTISSDVDACTFSYSFQIINPLKN